MLSNIVSILALLVAIASLGFTYFQFRRLQSVSKLQKANEVSMFAFQLRRRSQELREFIGRTDDVDEQDDILDSVDLITEYVTSKALSNPKLQYGDIYKMENKLLGLNLELDLLRKQIEEQARFNKEVAEFKASN